MLALNIVNRNFIGLFKPLDYDQGSPIGFLLVEKTANFFFGRNEYALRLFPLIVGIASIWLFYLILKRTTSRAGLLIALALFVFNPRLIYYSSEVKQYILDVAVTLGLLLLAYRLFDLNSKVQKRDFAWLALAGFLGIWFSQPAVFVLAGIGLRAIDFLFAQTRLLQHAICDWNGTFMGCDDQPVIFSSAAKPATECLYTRILAGRIFTIPALD